MYDLIDSVRSYFELRNRMWLTSDLRVPSTTLRDALSQAEKDARRKLRSFEVRRCRLVRAHSRLSVLSVEQQNDKALVTADESVTWVYRDGYDHNVESRLIRHQVKCVKHDEKWYVARDTSHREGTPPPAGETRVKHQEPLWQSTYSTETCTMYDRVRALRHADLWWNASDPSFAALEEDAANFVSQCLFAGHFPMRGGQDEWTGWWYRFSDDEDSWSKTWEDSTALFTFLHQKIGAKYATPRELKVGDVVFYDWEGEGRFEHAAIVSDIDGRGEPLVNAHSTPSFRRHYAYLDSPAWNRRTRYACLRLPDSLC